MDELQIDNLKIKDFELDVGMLPNGYTGLLGLDILKPYNFKIDLEKLELYSSTNN